MISKKESGFSSEALYGAPDAHFGKVSCIDSFHFPPYTNKSISSAVPFAAPYSAIAITNLYALLECS